MATLINAATGHETVDDFNNAGIPNTADSGAGLEDFSAFVHLNVLQDAAAGYDTLADFLDAGLPSAPADSGASLENPASQVSYILPSFGLTTEAREIEIGTESKETWGIVGE